MGEPIVLARAHARNHGEKRECSWYELRVTDEGPRWVYRIHSKKLQWNPLGDDTVANRLLTRLLTGCVSSDGISTRTYELEPGVDQAAIEWARVWLVTDRLIHG